jgi:hypothetical protein
MILEDDNGNVCRNVGLPSVLLRVVFPEAAILVRKLDIQITRM